MSQMHFYQPSLGHGLAHDPFNSIIAPRPIGWISSQSGDGVLNLAPYSFFNAFNYVPPIIGFASIGAKDSLKNIQETGEFCWNLVTKPLAEKMNQTCAAVGPQVDEFQLAGLTPKASSVVAVPHVAQTPVAFECKLSQCIQLTTASGDAVNTWLVLGEVVGVHIDKGLLKDGVFDTIAAQPALRGGGPADYFTISEALKFQIYRPA
ncbi:flavin reductase (DIM6/NTAB) family NADH-FMN oxidoreductase RutF [Gallaecimonas pentaromativorans]|uniref:Flavin reductase (DIM6/NTAB) family NADH-FMN oxidoreductase RutF n=2 Tax=Gallaecimonas pentaromativorans TaxID=584787 RepID=A0A3N1PNC8_9GAMM|nr:flavin reductase family protein [Gallaecimonas pentaromativorans]ROQ29669.1 flavin reductase (DIM6/NTAB) family NADH-FMN oxidoreductase RutF [Gallaecimonas pentaromativorans]